MKCKLAAVSPHGEGDTPETCDFTFVWEAHPDKTAFVLHLDSEYCEIAEGTLARLVIPNARNIAWKDPDED